MKYKALTIIIAVAIIVFLLLAVIVVTNNESYVENEVYDLTITPYVNIKDVSMQNTNFLWEEQNVSSKLNKEIYFTDSSIQDVIDFYSDEDILQYGDWTLKSTKVAATREDPFNVSFGNVKLQNETWGVYIAIKKLDDNAPANTIFGFAKGKWTNVEGCGES